MGYPAQNTGRASQSQYWRVFATNMIMVPILLFGGIYAIFSGNFALGILAIVAVLPIGIYFRITMMRRCRDIGWPPFIPWLVFGIQMLIGFTGGIRPTMGQVPSLPLLAVPVAVGLIDFVFSIVIGCIASKDDDYAGVFEPDERDYHRMNPGELSHASISRPRSNSASDSAIARALEARRANDRQPSLNKQEPTSVPGNTPVPDRPVGGFGRRIV
jgi:uncharacterized membrane protein YhaH (DUF805 family)